MKTELLVQMDGLARSNDLVFLLAASNLPWYVTIDSLESYKNHISTEGSFAGLSWKR